MAGSSTQKRHKNDGTTKKDGAPRKNNGGRPKGAKDKPGAVRPSTAGHPPSVFSKFVPEEVEAKFEAYFKECEWSKPPKPFTITGLANSIRIGLEQLSNYGKGLVVTAHPDMQEAVRHAKARVEQFNEEQLHTRNSTGAIFNLSSNFHWKNLKYVDTTIRDKRARELSTDELRSIASGETGAGKGSGKGKPDRVH